MSRDKADSNPAELGPGLSNPFGYIDHSRFAGFGVDLLFGELPGGSLAHVDSVPSGLKCNCVCPACRKTLVAKKGPDQAHHFAHQGKGNGCGRGAETNAHIWAKAVLAAALRIKLPALVATSGPQTKLVRKSDTFRFTSARLERRMGDIVPDVILTTSTGKELLVEVFVTHRCDEEKIGKLCRARLASIEVDMRSYRTCSDRETIEAALLEVAPRYWLFNEKEQLASEALREEILADKERKERAKRARDEMEARRLRQRVKSIIEAAQRARRSAMGAPPIELPDWLESIDDERVQVSIQGEGFRVPRLAWQTAIQARYLSPTVALMWEYGGLTVGGVTKGLAACIDPAFHARPDDRLRQAVRAVQPSFMFPDEAIDRYLDELEMQGYLTRYGPGEYQISDEWAESLTAFNRKRQEEERRRRFVLGSLDKILSRVPEDELDGFSPEYWLDRNVPGFALAPENLIVSGGDAWKRFDEALLAIERMLEGGDAIELTLGLPIGGEVTRAQQRALQKLEQEQTVRRTMLRNEAVRLLGVQAEGFLSQPSDAPTMTLLDRASEGDCELNEARRRLAARHHELEQIRRRESIAAECRLKLRKSADAVYDQARADLFMRSHDHRIASSPQEYCVDALTLSHCWALLPKAAMKRLARIK